MTARTAARVIFLALLGGASSADAAVSFSGPAYYSTEGSFLNRIASGDFNGDGISDIVALHRDESFAPYDNDHGFSYFQGVGDGTFLPPITTDISSLTTDLSRSIIGVDLNGDGNLDVVVGHFLNAAGTESSQTITVHLGDGTGHFNVGFAIASGPIPMVLAAGDFDEDGNQDLAVQTSSGQDGLLIHLGNGDGTFKPPVPITGSSSGYESSIAVGDVNADGHLDLVVANRTSVIVYLSAGLRGGLPIVVADSGAFSPQIALGDLDGDGNLDFVLSSWFGSLGTLYGSISVFAGNGQGSFIFKNSIPSSPGTALGVGVVLADFNTDGRPDIATGGDGILVLFVDANWNFSFGGRFAGSPQSIVDDFDRDGRPDLAGVGGSIAVLMNRSSYGCVDTLKLSYATGGTLNIGFTLNSLVPVVWSTWIAVQQSVIPLWSVTIPAVPNKLSFNLPIAAFPAIGNVGVLTTMSNASGLACGDWKIVDTGGAGPTPSTLTNLLASPRVPRY